MLLKKKRKGRIFNRKYYFCNIDMHSSLSCERISEHHNVLIYEYIVCHITGDSKKGYNIDIPGIYILKDIGKPPTVKLEVFAFYDHYSRIPE